MTEQRQFVRYLFLRAAPEWRRRPVAQRAADTEELAETVLRFRARLLLRTYSLVGTRADADLLFWQVAEDLETLQRFETAVRATGLGGYLEPVRSFLSMTRKSDYAFPPGANGDRALAVSPADAAYLFVYPFVKRREWYRLSPEARQEMMTEHVRVGREFPGVRINTTYSFGLDDQEFVVAFEGDDPGEFLDLVMALRSTAASAYTERDTPMYTCLQMSVREALDVLGGRPVVRRVPDARADGFVRVAAIDEIPDRGGRRCYLGAEAIALFRVGDRVYAVGDRCPHGRASLSEGRIDVTREEVVCPWHDGRFDLSTGHRVSGPPRSAVGVYTVRVEGPDVWVRACPVPDRPVGAAEREVLA